MASAEQFVVDYDATVEDRLTAFGDAIQRVGLEISLPTSVSNSTWESMEVLWSWFVVDSGVDVGSKPFTDAGVDASPPWWSLPDKLDDDVLFFVAGVASWMEIMLRDSYPSFVRRRHAKEGFADFNEPQHVIDFRLRNGCAQLLRGRESRRDRDYLQSRYRMFSEERRAYVAHSANGEESDSVVKAPVLVLDDPVFDEGEIGVEYDLRATPERLERFDELLVSSSIVRGIKDHEPGQYLSGTFHGDAESVRSEIDKLWSESARPAD